LQHISGYLNFQFKELFKKSDLVLNKIPTNTFQEKWLESGGTFFLYITDENGDKVLAEKIELQFPINDNISDTSNMSVWIGEGEVIFNPQNGPSPFQIWRDVTPVNDTNNVTINQATEQYVMNTIPFTWINCDHVFETNAVRVKVDKN